MTLADLAYLGTRERIRAAIVFCSPDVDPELHADLIAEDVLRFRVSDLAEETRAAAVASSDGTRRLVREGA